MRELKLLITATTQQAEDALKRTESALKDVESGAKDAGKGFDEFDKSTKTTGAGVGNFKLGMDALTGSMLQFVSFAAIGAAIDAAIEFGSAVNDLSARTGIGTDALQSLGFVAEQTGSSMEAFARSVSFLDKTLQAGGQKAVDVVNDLGLSVAGLLTLSPEDRFRKVAIAIGELEDPAERAYASTALFGRAGAELIPMFEELAQGAEDVDIVMQKQVIRNLDEAGDAMNYVTQIGKVVVGTLAAIGVESVKAFIGFEKFKNQLVFGVDEIKEQDLEKIPSLTKQLMPPGLASVAVDDFDKVSSALDRQRREAERAAREAERLAAAQEKARRASIVWGDGIEHASKWVERLDAEVRQLHSGGVKRLSDILEFDRTPVDNATAAMLKFQGSIKSFSAEGSAAWTGFAQSVQQQSPAVTKSFDGVRTALQSLPQVILGAIQGGGNALKSIGASIGGGLATDLISNFGNKLPSMMSGVLSTVAGPLGTMFGSLAGNLAGKLFGGLFGPSQQQQVDDMRRKFMEAGGGLQAMQDRADAAGVSMQGLFNARTTTQFQSAMNVFNQSLRESEERTQKTKEAMERWGLTIDQMGPKFAQQNINSKLLSILGDMELLTSAGADFNLVAAKMAPQINDLVNASIKAGTEVPREMEPILRKMFDLGLLTNASGDKLENFGDIRFATDINQQFSALISKMDELLSKFFGMENSLNRSREQAGMLSDIVENITPPQWQEPGGAFVGFDAGGMAGRDYRRPSSRDVIPALLRPGEVVLTPEQARMSSGAAGNITVNVSVAGYLDSFEARSNLAVVVREELAKTLRRTGRAA